MKITILQQEINFGYGTDLKQNPQLLIFHLEHVQMQSTHGCGGRRIYRVIAHGLASKIFLIQ